MALLKSNCGERGTVAAMLATFEGGRGGGRGRGEGREGAEGEGGGEGGIRDVL